MVTDDPKESPVSPSAGVSLASWVHDPPPDSKMYAEPASSPFGSSSSDAPMITLVPSSDMATDQPKRSPLSPSSANSLACWLQESPSNPKMYADPDVAPFGSPSLYAPTMAVVPSPAIATERPKYSPASRSSATNLACWLHASPSNSKMYAAPA